MARAALTARWVALALLIPASALAMLSAAPALAGTVSATPARGPGSADLILNNAAAAVKTANGQSWDLTVADTQVADTLTVGITRTVTTGGTGSEEHVWYFEVPASALTFDTATGAGTLKSGSAASPVATIDLNFKATSHKAATCTSGSETVYTGTLSGEAELVTGLTGGGTVGGTSVTFNVTGSAPQILVDSDCVAPTDECLSETTFSSAVTGAKPEAAGLDGTVDGVKLDFVTVASKKTLSSPKGAYRIDDGEVDTSPPSWNKKTKVLSVTTSPAGIVTGSATLSGGTDKSTTFPCDYLGKTYTVHVTTNTTANYTSPAGQDITAHTSLTGNLVAAPTEGTGVIDIAKASNPQ